MLAARPESPRMFDSDFADFFTRTPWWSVLVFWGPITVALVAYGIVANGVAWYFAAFQVLIGIVFWTLSEYWLHRTVFHWEHDSDLGRRFHFIVHGVHHDWHRDPFRLVMPPAAGVIIASFFWFGFHGIASVLSPWVAPTWVPIFMGGFLGGYMAYDMLHYAIHHVRFKNKHFVRLRHHHMSHHFTNHDTNFGITNTLWDKVFRTL